jgi:hypothetical protein
LLALALMQEIHEILDLRQSLVRQAADLGQQSLVVRLAGRHAMHLASDLTLEIGAR